MTMERCVLARRRRRSAAGFLVARCPGIDKSSPMRTQLGFFTGAGVLFLIASCSGTGTTGGSPTTTGGRTGTGGSGNAGTGNAGNAGGPTCISDLKSDNLNCGVCGNKCAALQACTAGVCTCAGSLQACTTGCTNLQSDVSNCGACGTACTSGLLCSQGKCSATCAATELQCGASCVDPKSDTTNCGSCGNKCAGGQACTNGVCGCPTGQTTCNGACIDTSVSVANCGVCGKACTTGQTCSAGNCVGGTGVGGNAGTGGAGGNTSTAGGGGVTANGGSGGAAGGAAGGAPPGRNGCVVTPGLISDFEEGTGKDPAVIKTEDRTGEFELFNDATSTSETMTVESSGGTADCDKFALHVKGSGYTSWGAGFGLSLVGSPKSPTPYNAAMHSFTGIKFKAKLGTGADAKSSVRFNLSTPWTENKENPGGQCTPTTATTTKAAADCYQHVGKFMAPGTGESELGSAWKTYTFCFDRDLYPLSLPSNLTTDQRNNVATNLLKVQFQFNRGKDYSGAYPSTGTYTAFAPSLPFDFWVDDIAFTTGECTNMTPSPSNGSPAKPFPQNANIGTCAPAANSPKFASALAQAYARWTKNFVQSDHIVAPEQSNAVTSEAMGYGMLIAAAMGDKTAFDLFWKYVKANGGSGVGGLMNWKNGESGSASDADADIAYALLMANAQWSSGGYLTPANDMAAAILSKDIVNNVVRGGSSFQGAPFNASYFAPAAYRKFTGFGTVITTNFGLVTTNVNAATKGVPTDWADPASGNPSDHGSAQVTSEITDGANGAMGYDAARVPWRLALDVCLGGGNNTALKAIVDYFGAKYDAGASIDLMKAGWLKKTDGPHTMAKDSQGSFIGPMGTGGMAMGNTAMRDRAFRTILDILESGDFNHTYFPSTVGLLTALMMSGNFPTP
jgi:hypothetical protein